MESMRRHHVFLFLHKVSFFMTKSLYVGNLPWSATEDDVRDLFAPYGEVTSVKLVSDRETGRARVFVLWRWLAKAFRPLSKRWTTSASAVVISR